MKHKTVITKHEITELLRAMQRKGDTAISIRGHATKIEDTVMVDFGDALFAYSFGELGEDYNDGEKPDLGGAE